MRRCVFLVVAVILVLAATGRGDDAEQKERKQFEGIWRAVSGEENGQAGNADEFKKLKMVFSGTKFTAYFGDQVLMEGTYTIDPGARPRTLDLQSKRGRLQGKTGKGIYELMGDTLKLCLVEPDQERPKEFTSQGGLGHQLLVYQRNKR